MEFRSFPIDGPLEILPKKLGDDRGYFSEIFRADRFAEHAGRVEFVQANQSLSLKTGTIRGIHFQSHPFAQGKLVRCVQGSVLDVAVDLRRDSPSYGRWVAVTLSADDINHLWIPAGFGHAFCTLEPSSVIGYSVTNYYSAENDLGVAWNDPDIAIEWPDVADPETLSPKDRIQPALADLLAYFSMEEASCA
jgi:dTDP-4-dehydrorhamnose 3,5-epimerase